MARATRRFRKRKRSSEGGSYKSNPPMISEIAEFAGPGFLAFAATRFGTRIAVTQINNRWPQYAKHAGALASIGAFLSAWLLAHKVKFLEKYQTPLVVGSAIATLQTIIQLYIPQIGWMVSDASDVATSDVQLPAGGGTANNTGLPAGMTATNDDPNLYVYNDGYDAGRYSANQQPASGNQAAAPPADDDLNLDNENLGIFAS